MLWAAGFIFAHNAIRAIMGPRVIKVEKVSSTAPVAQVASAPAVATHDACVRQHKAFQDVSYFLMSASFLF